ncbi:MAG: GxxExxY protein [Flavipsychrobacter sp.]|nr:GxxExxY protein [Flavipsychrobacter sp.]
MIDNQYKYSDITEKIIGCGFTVHNILGGGFQEVIYQRALALEFEDLGFSFTREQEMPLYYKDRHIGDRRVDFLVDEKVLVEIKPTSKLEDVHLAPAINDLEAFKLEVGLLLNFGGARLEFRRLMKSSKQLQQGNQIGYSDIKAT